MIFCVVSIRLTGLLIVNRPLVERVLSQLHWFLVQIIQTIQCLSLVFLYRDGQRLDHIARLELILPPDAPILDPWFPWEIYIRPFLNFNLLRYLLLAARSRLCSFVRLNKLFPRDAHWVLISIVFALGVLQATRWGRTRRLTALILQEDWVLVDLVFPHFTHGFLRTLKDIRTPVALHYLNFSGACLSLRLSSEAGAARPYTDKFSSLVVKFDELVFDVKILIWLLDCGQEHTIFWSSRQRLCQFGQGLESWSCLLHSFIVPIATSN